MGEYEQSVLADHGDITAIASDIDGTIAHYAKTLLKQGYVEATEEEYFAYKSARQKNGILTEQERHLERCYSGAERAARFRGIPLKFWRHEDDGTVLKLYELYNLSLSGALISEDTILLMELLQCPDKLYANVAVADNLASERCHGVLCILITGARTSTFRFRRESGALPHVCFDVCEGGGKIWCRLKSSKGWLHQSSAPTGLSNLDGFFSFQEPGDFDHQWLDRFYAVTGYHGNSGEEKPDRSFPLWQLEDKLYEEGYRTDHREFDTSWQIYVNESPCVGSNAPQSEQAKFPRTFDSAIEAEAYLKRVFRDEYLVKYGTTLHINLQRGQVNAKGCGKKEAMLHILESCQRTMTTEADGEVFCPEKTVAMFDDANDLPFAEQCGVGLIPSVAHKEVLDHPLASDHLGTRWFRPPVDGPLGSEWALWQVVLFKRNQLRQLQR